MIPNLRNWKMELEEELISLLAYWMKETPDTHYGGFIGRIGNNGEKFYEAEKGAVLHARILYTFSLAYRVTGNEQYKLFADRAYNFINNHFIDKQFGGVYWSVFPSGLPSKKHKQAYAQAFALYGLTEYYKITGDSYHLKQAVIFYQLIEEKFYDKINRGYTEALSETWNELPDQRLSTKDINAPKSFNTNLHILEAYTNLYEVWKEEGLKHAILQLIETFLKYIVIHKNKMGLFFTHQWQPLSGISSPGHEIEACWLLLEAARVIEENTLLQKIKQGINPVAEKLKECISPEGGLYYEVNEYGFVKKEFHWWCQAEAMVGFYECWKLFDKEEWLQKAFNNWQFISRYLIDRERGEWYWGVDENLQPMWEEDKAGFWKCPYHNGRACIKLIGELSKKIRPE